MVQKRLLKDSQQLRARADMLRMQHQQLLNHVRRNRSRLQTEHVRLSQSMEKFHSLKQRVQSLLILEEDMD